jgi:hypothetical protein
MYVCLYLCMYARKITLKPREPVLRDSQQADFDGWAALTSQLLKPPGDVTEL